jgi:hypothetical protein
MVFFPELISVIYETSQVAAGISGVVVFVLMLRSIGFDSTRSTGNRTEVLVGANFVLAILVAVLLVGPLFFFDQQYAMPGYPTEFFIRSFWVVYLCIMVLNAAGLAWRFHKISRYYLLIPVLGLVTASWVAKTMGVMTFVFQTTQINLFLKMLYELYCLVMGALYLAAAGVAVVALQEKNERRKSKLEPDQGQKPGQRDKDQQAWWKYSVFADKGIVRLDQILFLVYIGFAFYMPITAVASLVLIHVVRRNNVNGVYRTAASVAIVGIAIISTAVTFLRYAYK